MQAPGRSTFVCLFVCFNLIPPAKLAGSAQLVQASQPASRPASRQRARKEDEKVSEFQFSLFWPLAPTGRRRARPRGRSESEKEKSAGRADDLWLISLTKSRRLSVVELLAGHSDHLALDLITLRARPAACQKRAARRLGRLMGPQAFDRFCASRPGNRWPASQTGLLLLLQLRLLRWK